MSKAMPKELKREIRRIIETYFQEEPGYRFPLYGESPPLTRDAVLYLEEIGVLIRENGPGYRRLTAIGREYYEKLTTWAPWYWFNRNWFPAIVAAATITASIGGIIVDVLF